MVKELRSYFQPRQISGSTTIAELPALVEIQRAALLCDDQIPETGIFILAPIPARFERVNAKNRGIEYERLRVLVKTLCEENCLFSVLSKQLRYVVIREYGL
jgi:hypothetical protein